MQIGPKHWACVTIGGIGVPKAGSRWGRPQWFADQLARRGLVLLWSRAYERFGIAYRASPGRYVWEMWLAQRMNPMGQPVPCNNAALQVVLDLWNRHRAMNVATIQEALAQSRRNEARKRYTEAATEDDEDREPVMDFVALQNRHRTPHGFSDLGQAHGRAARRRAQRQQRKLVAQRAQLQ